MSKPEQKQLVVVSRLDKLLNFIDNLDASHCEDCAAEKYCNEFGQGRSCIEIITAWLREGI